MKQIDKDGIRVGVLILLSMMMAVMAMGFSSALLEVSNEVPSLKENLEISDSANIYPAIEIKDNLGLPLISNVKAELVLTEHQTQCSNDCLSIFQITTYEDSPLVDDIKFYTLIDDGVTLDEPREQNIRSYSLSYWGNIIDYETQCIDGETIVSENGTSYTPQECSQVEVGSHESWVGYTLGQELPAGTYKVKLSGEKRPTRSVDWIIETQGKVLSEWAVWSSGNELVNYDLSEISTETTHLTNNISALNKSINYLIGEFKRNDGFTMNMNVTFFYQNGSKYSNYQTDAGIPFNVYTNFTFTNPNNLTPVNFVMTEIWRSGGSAGDIIYSRNRLLYGINNSYVLLNSPSPGSTQSTTLVTTNASAVVTGGASLVNATLYDNSTGSWGARNSTSYPNSVNVSYENLKLYYKLDELSGTNVIDYLGVNNGTRNGPTQGIAGKINYSYDFDGSNDYISGGTSGFNGPSMTYNLWFNPDTLNIRDSLFDTRPLGIGASRVYFDESNSNLLKWELGGSSGTGTCTIAHGMSVSNWYMITLIVYSDSKTQLWIDGVAKGNCTNSVTAVTTSLEIGRLNGADYIDGKIDEFAVWNKVLSSSEISQLYNSGNGRYPFPSINSSTQTFTNTYPSGSNILWNYQFCDSDGACGFATSNYTFSVDSQAPTITLNYPTALINYGAVNGTLQLNVTATDSNLASVWYNYNGTNITIAGAVSGVYNLSNITLSTKKNITIYANDTAGNLNATTFSWDYYVFENSRTYNPTTTELSQENFALNVTFYSGYSPSTANLIYNGTSYPSTISYSNGNTLFLNNLEIPIASGGSFNFYWNITYTDGVTTYYQPTSTSTQTIGTILLIACNSTYNQTALNYTIREEQTFNLLNGSLEATFTYWTNGSSGVQYKTFTYSNTTQTFSNFRFCISPSYANLKVSGIVAYSKTGYDQREYWYNDANVNNVSQNTTLYLAATNATDIFTFGVIDESDNNIEGAYIYVQRWDIGTGNYYTVNVLKTGNDGRAITNLRLNDAFYRYVVVYNGQTYLTTDPVKETSTSRTLRIYLRAQNPYQYFEGVSHSLTFNNATNTTTFTYTDTTGAIATGCLYVYNYSTINRDLIYSSCLNSVSGSISYPLVGQGTFVAEGQLTLISNYSSKTQMVDSLIINLGKPQRFVVIGKFGQAISLIAFGTVALIGVASGSIPLGLFLMIAVFIGLWQIGLINVTTSIYSIISLIIMLILTGLRRRGG